MITIIEGVDGTGKTTLAKSAAFADHHYVHCGPPKTDSPFLEYFQLAKDAAGSLNNTIFDRYHLGERVYGEIYRKNDRLGKIRQRMLERYLLSQQAVLILCAPDYRVCSKHFLDRALEGKEMLTKDQGQLHFALYQKFKYLLADLEIPHVIVDPFKLSADEIREKVDTLRPPQNLGPGVGAFAEGVTVLVGDRCNDGPFNEPFIGDTGCSPWLAEQLNYGAISEDSLYWINATAPDGDPTDGSFLKWLKPKRLIALGNNAADWCHHVAGDDFCKVPHPSFWKRFKSGKTYPLFEMLEVI